MSGLFFDWNSSNVPLLNAPDVLDDTLRDGLQSPSAKKPTLREKKELLELTCAIGSNAAILGLPGAGPHEVSDIAHLVKFCNDTKLAVELVCAVRTHDADISSHLELCDATGHAVSAALFLGCSPIRRLAEGWNAKEQVKRVQESVEACVTKGVPVMFVTEDTTRSSPADLREIYLAALDVGATRLCLADTVGHSVPAGVRALVEFVREIIDASGTKAKLDWHGHNDRGLALANSMAAIEAGVSRVHATGLGLGERAGNTPLEQLVVNLELMGWSNDKNLERLQEYCEKVSRYCDAPLPVNAPLVGRDAFRTATGIHAAAIRKSLALGRSDLAELVYSAIPASRLGREQTIEIGFLSGRSNALHWLSVNYPRLPAQFRDRCVEKLLAEARTLNVTLDTPTIQKVVGEVLRNHIGEVNEA